MKTKNLFNCFLLSVILFVLSFHFVLAQIQISTDLASKWKPELMNRTQVCNNIAVDRSRCWKIYESCFDNTGRRVFACHLTVIASFLSSVNYNVYFTEKTSNQRVPEIIPLGTILKLNVSEPQGEWFLAGGSFDTPPITFVEDAQRDYENMVPISPLYRYSIVVGPRWRPHLRNVLYPKLGIAATNPIKNMQVSTNDKFEILREGNDYYLKAVREGRGEITVTFPQVFAYATIDNLWFERGYLPQKTYRFSFNIISMPTPKYTLNVSKIGEGKILGPGIDCGIDCTETYDQGTFVSLQPIPNSGWRFVGWSGDCSGTGPCNLTMDNNKNVTAQFQLENRPPTAMISCDPSACGTTGCQAYMGCLFRFLNNSTDPDGNSDIVRSEWDILDTGQNPDIICEGVNALCNFTPQTSLLSPGSYRVRLKVRDSVGNSNSVVSDFYILREAVANFMCSLDNTNWKNCTDIKPYQGQILYLKDDPSLPLYSTPSEGATVIVNRVWKLNGDIFSSDNNTNPSVTILKEGTNIIELTILDDKGRRASVSYQFSAQKPPIWWPR